MEEAKKTVVINDSYTTLPKPGVPRLSEHERASSKTRSRSYNWSGAMKNANCLSASCSLWLLSHTGLSPVTGESVTQIVFGLASLECIARSSFHDLCFFSNLQCPSSMSCCLEIYIKNQKKKIKGQMRTLSAPTPKTYSIFKFFWVVPCARLKKKGVEATQRLRVADSNGSWLNSFLCSSCKTRMSGAYRSIRSWLPWVKRNPERRFS